MTSCTNWNGSLNSQGYARIWKDSKWQRMSHIVWKESYGLIPQGLFVLHHCDNPRCVNPKHLFLGNQKQNMQDCAAKGRLVQQVYGPNRCKRGHELSSDNVYVWTGGRRCKLCHKNRNAKSFVGTNPTASGTNPEKE
jgi:hypothetical protein